MIALAALRLGAARDWAEALLTPVTVVVLLAEAARRGQQEAQRSAGGGRGFGGGGGEVRRADGSRVVRVRSLSELAGLVQR